ncbi:PREDICTED: transmembrane protein 45B-like [Branchiostoma belcheri]|uniref:Transmembrane protein 45B-like n=1 Tax=Branchiostoma belcheri TaxID=7741 RepID=A0A6P4ZTM4_BRABE|nr:PREDICTED: transmembrane protein 45B-like [Branchiostoma belcheri]
MDMEHHGHSHSAEVIPDPSESGSFEGHALLGTFFFVFGLWYSVKHSFLVLDSLHTQGSRQPARHKTWRDHPGCAKRTLGFLLYSMDPMFKITACTIGMLSQMSLGAHWTLRDPVTGEFVEQGDWQLVTMYSFFFFSGLVDILVRVKAPIPPNSDKFFVSVALFIEAYLFFYHPGGSEAGDRLYQLLFIAIFGAAVAAMLWACLPESQILPLFISALVLLQGTWFWQVAGVLYPLDPARSWDLESHNTLMFLPLGFCWHLFGNIALIFVLYAVIHQFVKRGYRLPKGL